MAEKTYLQAISRRPPAGDAARQARVRDRRGRRRLRRRVQGDARVPGGVRAVARDRRAALRDGDRRRLHRRRDDGHAPGRRDAVRRLRLVRAGTTSSPSPRSSAAAPARPVPIVVRLPVGRRLLRRPVPLAEPGELVRAHPRAQVRLPGDARGREGAASSSAIEDPNPVLFFEHKHLYRRIKGEVPDERYTTPIGKARIHREGDDVTVDHVGRDGLHGRGGGDELATDGVSVEILDLRTRDAVGQGGGARERRARRRRCSCCTRTRAPAASAPRSPRRSPRRRSRTSTRPSSGSPRPTRPCPSRPPLEKAFIPQVDDVVAGLRELAEY